MERKPLQHPPHSLAAKSAQAKQGAVDLFSAEGLPEELTAQLRQGGSRLETHEQTLAVMRKAGRPLTLDELLIGWYRAYGEVLKRANMNSRLRTMMKRKRVIQQYGRYSVVEAAAE